MIKIDTIDQDIICHLKSQVGRLNHERSLAVERISQTQHKLSQARVTLRDTKELKRGLCVQNKLLKQIERLIIKGNELILAPNLT